MIPATSVDEYAHKLRALEVNVDQAEAFFHRRDTGDDLLSHGFISAEHVKFFARFINRHLRQSRQPDLVNEGREPLRRLRPRQSYRSLQRPRLATYMDEILRHIYQRRF